ncbi:hypothetical protein DFH09DRAFT_19929 [Mycena vulgaris]|nr:hypothetical protein DFH09DRAFT_19929 [Mycena vulgaris]
MWDFRLRPITFASADVMHVRIWGTESTFEGGTLIFRFSCRPRSGRRGLTSWYTTCVIFKAFLRMYWRGVIILTRTLLWIRRGTGNAVARTSRRRVMARPRVGCRRRLTRSRRGIMVTGESPFGRKLCSFVASRGRGRGGALRARRCISPRRCGSSSSWFRHPLGRTRIPGIVRIGAPPAISHRFSVVRSGCISLRCPRTGPRRYWIIAGRRTSAPHIRYSFAEGSIAGGIVHIRNRCRCPRP